MASTSRAGGGLGIDSYTAAAGKLVRGRQDVARCMSYSTRISKDMTKCLSLYQAQLYPRGTSPHPLLSIA